MSKKILLTMLIIPVLFGVIFLFRSPTNDNRTNTVANPDDYPLLARRIFLENPSEAIVNFSPLRKTLNQYFEDNKITGSLYFEYLPTGTSIRIAGDEKEVAASLIKLPAALDLYKAHELGTLNLDQEVTVLPEYLDDEFGSLYRKGAGYKISLREAAKIMLKDSDNTALKIIASALNGKIPEEINSFTFLDADFTQNIDLTISISPRSYSSFLKCLYFSCYLEKKHSQEILDILSETKFTSRIVSGVGDDIKVAHKIGNFGQTTQNDCGIVYLENKNYVLCVMIDGPDNSETDKKIAELSKLTFDYLSNK